jgi:hypothetical protein
VTSARISSLEVGPPIASATEHRLDARARNRRETDLKGSNAGRLLVSSKEGLSHSRGVREIPLGHIVAQDVSTYAE